MLNHLNHDFDGLAPDVTFKTGDRYYGQDQSRDFWYDQDRLGQVAIDALGDKPFILGAGGLTVKGAGDTLTILAVIGFHEFDVRVPDSFAGLPPSVKTEVVEAIRVKFAGGVDIAIASAVLDNATINYVKLRYKDDDGPTRARAKKVGSYAYEKIPSSELIVDEVANTDKEILLDTFVGPGGGPYVFSQSSDKRIYPAVEHRGNCVNFSSPFTQQTYNASGTIAKVDYFESSSKLLLLATKTFNYVLDKLDTLVLTNGSDTWTQTVVRDATDRITSVTTIRT